VSQKKSKAKRRQDQEIKIQHKQLTSQKISGPNFFLGAGSFSPEPL
jgi:hypothetical protein